MAKIILENRDIYRTSVEITVMINNKFEIYHEHSAVRISLAKPKGTNCIRIKIWH
jgi:hypothetical protein